MKNKVASLAMPTVAPTQAATVQPTSHQRHSYRDILKSSAMIGGSTAINVAIGIVRTKVLAVLLGPAGYGIMGTYTLIVELAHSIAQLGVNSSGVRQIADAVATGDKNRIARTVSVLRRVSVVCALLGSLALALSASMISKVSFGTDIHALDIAWLSLAVFCLVIAGNQGALLQGMRRIGDIAKISVLGGILGTVIAIPMIFFFRETGIAPAMIIVAACSVATSWWYSQKLPLQTPKLSFSDVVFESGNLFKLGLAFLGSALIMQGVAYVVRIILLRQYGLESAGIFQAAWTLGGLYIGFILHALGTDFYPRLVGAVHDNIECNRLVNEQAHVSILLALPGVLATIVFAPLVISLFYSSKFAGSTEVLRWICLGMAIRVLTYPMGYIIVAKNLKTLFFAIDAAWAVVNLFLTWWWVRKFGVVGAGMAYAAAYVFHGLLVYPITKRLSGFGWVKPVRRTVVLFVLMTTAVFVAFQELPAPLAMLIGVVAIFSAAWYSIYALVSLLPPEQLPVKVQKGLAFMARIRLRLTIKRGTAS